MPIVPPTPPKAPVSVKSNPSFVGMRSNNDPHDLPPGGSRVQVNVTIQRPGELATRGGLKRLQFED